MDDKMSKLESQLAELVKAISELTEEERSTIINTTKKLMGSLHEAKSVWSEEKQINKEKK